MKSRPSTAFLLPESDICISAAFVVQMSSGVSCSNGLYTKARIEDDKTAGIGCTYGKARVAMAKRIRIAVGGDVVGVAVNNNRCRSEVKLKCKALVRAVTRVAADNIGRRKPQTVILGKMNVGVVDMAFAKEGVGYGA